MNKRIQELAEQADLHFSKNGLLYPGHGVIDLQVFAELIIRECAQLAMTQHNSTSPDDYDEMDPYDKGCDDTASRISGLIRRTFGVKE